LICDNGAEPQAALGSNHGLSVPGSRSEPLNPMTRGSPIPRTAVSPQLPDQLRGYATNQTFGLDVLGDDGAGGHRRAAPDTYAGHDDGARTDPTVVLDADWVRKRRPARGLAPLPVGRMRARADAHVGPDEHPVADGHGGVVVDRCSATGVSHLRHGRRSRTNEARHPNRRKNRCNGSPAVDIHIMSNERVTPPRDEKRRLDVDVAA
jgi:hypothetical protein